MTALSVGNVGNLCISWIDLDFFFQEVETCLCRTQSTLVLKHLSPLALPGASGVGGRSLSLPLEFCVQPEDRTAGGTREDLAFCCTGVSQAGRGLYRLNFILYFCMQSQSVTLRLLT